MDLYPLSLLVSLVMGFTRKYLLVNSVTGDVSKVCHQFIGSKWDTDKSSNHYGILVSSVNRKTWSEKDKHGPIVICLER